MKRFKTVLFMIIIAGLFGGGVTGIYLSSQKTVEKNDRFIEQKALVELFGLGDVRNLSKKEIAEIVDRQIDRSDSVTDPETGKKIPLLKAYSDPDRKHLIALGFPFSGIGFWAEIKGYIAVNSDITKTVGIKIIKQSETPGLGGRIEEPAFIKPFEKGLDITAPEPGKNYIYMTAAGSEPDPGTPRYKRSFNAITGATQTSLAMERMLNSTLKEFRRAIDQRLEGEKS